MEKASKKFLQEATELIDDLEKAVLQLENNREDHTQLEEVFRVMHTFKGTAKMFGFHLIGEFTHHLESIYDDLRNGTIQLTDEILEVSLNAVDFIRSQLNSADQTNEITTEYTSILTIVKRLSTEKASISISDKTLTDNKNAQLYLIRFAPALHFLKDGSNPLYILEDLSALGSLYCKTYTEALPAAADFVLDNTYLRWDILLYTNADSKTIRNEFMFVEEQSDIHIESVGDKNCLADKLFLDFIKHQNGSITIELIESFYNKQKTQQATESEKGIQAPQRSQQQTIKVTYDKIDKLMSIVSELVTTQARLSLFAEGTKSTELEEISENVEKLVRQLRDEAFSISLLPFGQVSMRFERLVRDMSKTLHKKIKLIITGGETELDKKIIENLIDPLLHILRNSMDHGIENPEERKRKGKDETGTIQLKSYYSGTNVIIEVRDDGAGINKERVWQRAVQNGLVKETEHLADRQIFDFIFHAGFSTARQVTDVSGRGVGMDVVRKAVNNLRGEIEIDSQQDKGSVFRLILPLSLSIIDGLLVDVHQTKYVVPLTAIDKCYEVESITVKPDMNDLLILDGEQIPYINLRRLFHCEGSAPQYVNLIVAKHDEQKVVFEVDSIVDEYQAVIKPLGKIYREQEFASGATILGNGTVALVLDTNRLVSTLSN